jgi:hypothetical protein
MMSAPAVASYQPPKPKVYEKGPASPDDMVNGQVVENINDRSQQDVNRNRNKGPIASSQSGSKTNKAY